MLPTSMFIKIHIDGVECPLCVPVSKGGKIMSLLEKEGKSFRLGDTV